jgi:hypothetical protein
MADGYVLLEINTEGDFRVQGDQVHWFDFRLQDVCFSDAEGEDQLYNQLPVGLRDCLVMVMFDYKCNCSRDWAGDYDCDEEFIVSSHYIVKEGYKEFYRELVTVELESFNDFGSEKEEYYLDVVGDWEEFYDEDFVPFKKQPKKINGVIDLWDLIKGKDF